LGARCFARSINRNEARDEETGRAGEEIEGSSMTPAIGFFELLILFVIMAIVFGPTAALTMLVMWLVGSGQPPKRSND
jgi:hypothetical protein